MLDPIVVILGLTLAGAVLAHRRGERRSRAVFTMLFGCLYLASTPFLSESLCYLLERSSYVEPTGDRGPLDVVVVLAGGVTSGRSLPADVLNRQSTMRLVKAIEVFRTSGARVLVCSGTTPSFDEAGLMAVTASRLGVPPGSIKVDTRSRNTREHAVEISKMFAGQRVRVGLVTSAYHMPRSRFEFQKYFPDLVPYPTDFLHSYRGPSLMMLVPSSPRLEKFSIAVSEIVGIGWSRLRSRLAAA